MGWESGVPQPMQITKVTAQYNPAAATALPKSANKEGNIRFIFFSCKFVFIVLLRMVLRTIASPGGKLSRQSRD